MRITEYLKPDLIVPDLAARDKGGVIAELSRHMGTHCAGVSAIDVERVLWERERLESTGITDGVAIPHGKLAELANLLACFARSRAGVDFQAMDGRLSYIFFCLVAPENSVGLHLKALARISRMCKDPAFRGRLIEAPGPTEIYQAITDEDARA